MNYRVIKSEGNGMESDVTKIVKAGLMLLGCGVIIVVLLVVWVSLPSPRLERAKIAMHDQQTFAKLQAKHGKVNTGVVIYEEDGQVYYYKGEEKIKFQ